MKRILLSLAVLLFLAAGIGGWLLYSLGEKAIEELEESIIEFNELEADTAQGSIAEKSPEAEPEVSPALTPGSISEPVKQQANVRKATINGSKVNNSTITPGSAPSKNAVSSNSIQKSEEYYFEEAETAKEVRALKEKLPISESTSLMKLVLSKLTRKDIAELKGMLSNGITSDEKERAKEILYSRLSSEDINRIKEAYIKYIQ